MTNDKTLGAIALTALLLASACGTKKTPPANQVNATQTAEATNVDEAVNEVAVPVPEEVIGNDTTPVKNLIAANKGGVVRIAPKAGGSGNAPVRVAGAGALARYVDMRPREIEGGRSFLGDPAVKRAIAANVRDAGVRNFIYNYSGPDAPIARTRNGRIIAWGCEAHNCGFHNWAVSIAADGSSAEICHYQDDERPDGSSTWYLRGGKTVKRAGNCPDE
jgi:hypothetical protein